MSQNRLIFVALFLAFFIAAPWMAVNLLAVTAFSYAVFGVVFKARRWWLPVVICAVQFAVIITNGILQ